MKLTFARIIGSASLALASLSATAATTSFSIQGISAALLTEGLSNVAGGVVGGTTSIVTVKSVTCSNPYECILDNTRSLSRNESRQIWGVLHIVRSFEIGGTLQELSVGTLSAANVQCSYTSASSFYNTQPAATCGGTLETN